MTTAIAEKVQTADRTLTALDFKAQLVPVYDQDGKELDGYKRVWRPDNDETLSIVSDQYKLVEHKEAMFPAVELLGKEGWSIHQSRIERGGASAFVELRRITATVKVLNEPVGQRIMLRNSYDKSSSLILSFGAIVLKCLNGAVVPGKGSFGFNSSHTGDVSDRLEGMLGNYGKIEAALGVRMLEHYSRLDKLVPAEIGHEIIKRAVGERNADSILGYWTKGIGRDGRPNAWNLYNGITQYLTHDFKGGWDRRERLNSQSLGLIAQWVETEKLPMVEGEGN